MINNFIIYQIVLECKSIQQYSDYSIEGRARNAMTWISAYLNEGILSPLYICVYSFYHVVFYIIFLSIFSRSFHCMIGM